MTADDATRSVRFLADRDDRLRMVFRGPQAKAVLGGLLSNDVTHLTPGEMQRAAALTAKGRVLALCRVVDRGDDLLLDTEAASAEGFVAMIRKYVNPRLAAYAVVTGETACLGVHGADAEAAVRDARTAGLTVLPSAELATPGWDVIGPREAIARLRPALEAAGWAAADAATLEAERIEGGVPRWGVDMTDETIAQEAGLDALDAISFAKGCYTGQEVVARIHFRGHVNRLLRRLRSDEPLAVGATVRDAAGAEVGAVRSTAVHARRGPVALAMVRREVAIGDTVTVERPDGTPTAATVEALTPERSPTRATG